MPLPVIVPILIAVGGSAALDATVQRFTRGRIRWGEVALAGALGLLPGGVWVATGKRLVQPAVTAGANSQRVLRAARTDGVIKSRARDVVRHEAEAASGRGLRNVATVAATAPVVVPAGGEVIASVQHSARERRQAASDARARAIEAAVDPGADATPPRAGMLQAVEGR